MADKNIDTLVNQLARQPIDLSKYPGLTPNDRKYEYSLENKRKIFDNDAFTDWYNNNANVGSPSKYVPDQYKFRVDTGGKYHYFPTFDEAYKFATETPVQNPFELSDDRITKDIRRHQSGSMSQEIKSLYDELSDKYGIDLENLIYGEQGFMNTKYPNDFPDFNGDVVYSPKYWAELDNWFKENTGMSLADRKAYVEKRRKELYGI